MATDLMMPSGSEGKAALARMSDLQPTTLEEAMALAKLLSQSSLVPEAVRGKPADCLLIGLFGRDLGLSFAQAFSSINVIGGKPVSSAQLMVALVKRHPRCRYFRLVKSDDTGATWETHREGSPEPEQASFGPAEAKRLKLDAKDNYQKQAATMYRWRAAAALARTAYPDAVLGLYIEEEADELRGADGKWTAPKPTVNPASGLIPIGAPAALPEAREDDELEAAKIRSQIAIEEARQRKIDEADAAKFQMRTAAPVEAEPVEQAQTEPFDPESDRSEPDYADLSDEQKIGQWSRALERISTRNDLAVWSKALTAAEPDKASPVREALRDAYNAKKEAIVGGAK